MQDYVEQESTNAGNSATAAEASATAAASSAAAAAASAAQAAQQALVVNFAAASGTSLTPDKTFEEVKAALDANAVVLAYRGTTAYTVNTISSTSIRFCHAEISSGGAGKYYINVRYINFTPTSAYFSTGGSSFYTTSQTDATFATKTALSEGIEKAAAAGRMEVIYSTTLTEEVNDITVSALPNGDSFSLDRVAIYMQLPSSITVKINELSVWFNEQASSNRVHMQTSQVGCRYFYFIGERIGNDDIHVWDCCASIAAAAANMANQRRLASLGAASSILINSVNNLPVGTQVMICGRRVTQ